MSVKVSIYNRPYSYDDPQIPILHLLLETYYDEQGDAPDEVKWLIPTDFLKEKELKDFYLKEKPDVIGLSLYVWNVKEGLEFAKWLGEALPKSLLILGGPGVELIHHPDFFIEHPYVDALADPMFFGEWFFLDLLNQRTKAKCIDWSEVQGALYSDRGRLVRSPKVRSSASFTFTERSIYDKPWLNDYIDTITDNRKSIHRLEARLETNRGCPYQCSFCERGVGERRKVVQKPLSTVKKEIKDIAKLDVKMVKVIDANFGILKRDLDVVELIGQEICAKSPKAVAVSFTGLSKNNKKHIYQIHESLYRHQANIKYYRISMQDVESEILKLNGRMDLPLEDNFELAKRIHQDFGYSITAERILGLPGKTLKGSYEDYDTLFDFMPNDHRLSNVFILLKGTPASMPAFIKKFGVNANFTVTKDAIRQDLIKEKDYLKEGTFHGAVLETNSYSRYEWFKMYLTDQFYLSATSKGILTELLQYLKLNHGLKVSQFLERFIEDLPTSDNGYAKQVWSHFSDSLLALEKNHFPLFIKSPRDEYVCPYHLIFTYYCLVNKQEFMTYVHDCLLKLGIDNLEAIRFYCLSVVDSNYSPLDPPRVLRYKGMERWFMGQSVENFTIWWHEDPLALIWAGANYQLSLRMKAL